MYLKNNKLQGSIFWFLILFNSLIVIDKGCLPLTHISNYKFRPTDRSKDISLKKFLVKHTETGKVRANKI